MVDKRTKVYLAKLREERIARGESSARTFINEVREPGPRSLIVAIVDQAMRDYWLFHRAGAIKGGKRGKWPRFSDKGRPRDFYAMHEDDLVYLLEFFQGNCSKLLALAGIDIKPEKIVKAMRRLERSGDWQCFYGQGKSAFKVNNGASNESQL